MVANIRGNRNNFSGFEEKNIGNLKKISDIMLPCDDVGNVWEEDGYSSIRDDIGNSYDRGIPRHFGMVKKSEPPKAYFEGYRTDFTKLLAIKDGLSFSFAPKKTTRKMPPNLLTAKLNTIKAAIEEVLIGHESDVNFSYYEHKLYQLAVFFIHPLKCDQKDSKDMIAALRKSTLRYFEEMANDTLSIFLVLESAKEAIEDHLIKLGAKKIVY